MRVVAMAQKNGGNSLEFHGTPFVITPCRSLVVPVRKCGVAFDANGPTLSSYSNGGVYRVLNTNRGERPSVVTTSNPNVSAVPPRLTIIVNPVGETF